MLEQIRLMRLASEEIPSVKGFDDSAIHIFGRRTLAVLRPALGCVKATRRSPIELGAVN